MKLFKERERDFTLETDNNQLDVAINRPKIERIMFDQITTTELLSPLSLFFMAPFIFFDSNGVHNIVFNDTSSYAKIIKEIACHFEKVLLIDWGNKKEITIQNLKLSSKKLFETQWVNKEISSVISDLYKNSHPTSRPVFEQVDPREYDVNLELINPINIKEVNEIWNFIAETYISNTNEFTFLPLNWTFDESFKNSISIRAFSGLCTSMYITVDHKTNIIRAVSMR
ncbi:hypothetical protein [uncultured Paenibacillus sp.]|uniref:hypothetical protein n=1 Tax=uncultured Paenibacillus sp. TaxID=227322 RepID=UPI0015A9055E|nr:hypothetical protein [uncultured Paenibacillus sp.]